MFAPSRPRPNGSPFFCVRGFWGEGYSLGINNIH